MGFPISIGRVWLKEQSGGWGTEETSFADADHISAQAFLPDLVQEELLVEAFRGSFAAHAIEAGSREGSELQITNVLEGLSSSALSADPTATPQSLLLKSVLGSQAAIGYKAAVAGSGQAVDKVTYTDADLTTGWSGMGVLLAVVAATSGRKIAWAKTINTAATPDELVPWINLPGVVTNGSVSYGGLTHWLSLVQPTPFTAQVGLGQSDGAAVFRARDCVCNSVKIDLVGGQLPKATFGIKAGYWSDAGTWVPAQYAQQYPNLPMLDVANGSTLSYGGTLTTIPSVSIEMTANMEAARGIGGFAKWIMTDREVKVTTTHLLTDFSQITAPGTEVTTGLQIDLCTIPGRAAGLFGPTYMASVVSKDEAMGGFVVRKNIYKFRIPATETAGANAAGSPFRFMMA